VDDFGDFGEFTVTPTRKPIAGVTQGEIPPPLHRMLTEHAPKALADKDYELTLTAKDEATAKRLAGYARAWGARQEPKLYIHKLPNGKRYDARVARLAVDLDSEVSEENRPGRKAK
jgi:hypothetical protein